MSDLKIKKGSNFTAYESGTLKEWPEHTVELPGLGEIPGKLFLKESVGFTGCEISVNSMAPGGACLFIINIKKMKRFIYLFREKDKFRWMTT